MMPQKTTYKSSTVMLSIFLLSVNNSFAANGEDIYNNNCILCHGEYAHGAMPGVPDLYINKAWSMRTDSELVKRINAGIQSTDTAIAMPPKGGNPNLTDEDIKVSVQYMRKLLKAGH